MTEQFVDSLFKVSFVIVFVYYVTVIVKSMYQKLDKKDYVPFYYWFYNNSN